VVSADEATPAEPVAATPDPAPVETPTPEPVAPDPVAELRERNARLEGEMAALRAQVNARPAAEAPAQWTPQTIRAAYDAGQITDDQRVALFANLQTKAEIAEYDAGRRAQDLEARAGSDLQAYMRAYPALNDPTSETMQRIAAELGQMSAYERANPRSLVAQLRAVKSVLGPMRTDGASTARRGIPVGSPGASGGGAPSSTSHSGDPLKGIPKSIVDGWTTRGWLKSDEDKRFYAQRYRSRPRAGAA
jgi:hypothetical protein